MEPHEPLIKRNEERTCGSLGSRLHKRSSAVQKADVGAGRVAERLINHGRVMINLDKTRMPSISQIQDVDT